MSNLGRLTLRGIDVIDLNGCGANTRALSAADVFAISDRGVLRIMGGADDFVNSPIDVWVLDDGGGVTIAGEDYARWVFSDATLFIDTDIGLNHPATTSTGGSSFGLIASNLGPPIGGLSSLDALGAEDWSVQLPIG